MKITISLPKPLANPKLDLKALLIEAVARDRESGTIFRGMIFGGRDVFAAKKTRKRAIGGGRKS
jgi:hypothetical protein